MRALTMIIVCFVVLLQQCIGFSDFDTIGNPYDAPEECGVSSRSYICDPRYLLPDAQRSNITRLLARLNGNNICGQCVAVAVIPQVGYGTLKQAHAKTKKLAIGLAKGGWSFPDCDSLAVIIVNTGQRYVWFQPGLGSRLCNEIGDIFKRNKRYFAKSQFGKGIEGMILTYYGDFKSRYRDRNDCEIDVYPCAKESKPHYSLSELETMLPNPAVDPYTCQTNNGQFLCDPEKALDGVYRNELSQTLSQVNSDMQECGQCILVALLGNAHASTDTLQKLAKRIASSNWEYPECRAKLLILVARDVGFVWLQGTAKTMYCRELGNIFASNKDMFVQGDFYDGIRGIVDSFSEAVSGSDSCDLETCQSMDSSSDHGGIGGSFKSKALEIVVNHKVLVIAIVVGLLCLAGCVFCVGFMCCREKTMGALRTAGGAVARRGPGWIRGMTGSDEEKMEYSGTTTEVAESWGAGGYCKETEEVEYGEGGGGGGSF